MKSFRAESHNDFDDVSEKVPIYLSAPAVAGYVVLLMALGLLSLNTQSLLLMVPMASKNSVEHEELEKIYKTLTEESGRIATFKSAQLESRAVSLTFQADNFFDVGQATLKPAAREELLITIAALAEMKIPFTLSVEGHTDSSPVIKYRHKFPTNWELSSFRASAVVRLFEEKGFPASKLSVAGFGSQRKVAIDRTPAGEDIDSAKALNRRITLRLYPEVSK
jgi:flagellar motor protein MotB